MPSPSAKLEDLIDIVSRLKIALHNAQTSAYLDMRSEEHDARLIDLLPSEREEITKAIDALKEALTA